MLMYRKVSLARIEGGQRGLGPGREEREVHPDGQAAPAHRPAPKPLGSTGGGQAETAGLSSQPRLRIADPPSHQNFLFRSLSN